MSRFELLSEDRLLCSPSSKDGISIKDENELRMAGCNFLRNLCKNLDLYPFVIICEEVFLYCVQNHM